MTEKVRVLVADDELLARKRLTRLLAELPEVECVGECSDGVEVLERVKAGGVDVILLDIHMPNLTGMDAIQLLPEPAPRVVFCTAHGDRAVQAFEVGAVDYLLKPIEAERLKKALLRVRERPMVPDAPAVNRLAVPTRQGIVLVDPASITHATIEAELVTLHTLQGDLLSDFTLRELEDKVPEGTLTRVHRKALVNLAHLVRLEPTESGGYVARTVKGASVEVSRQAARELRRRLGLRKTPGDDEG
jgi:two-component system LytT family response regulator